MLRNRLYDPKIYLNYMTLCLDNFFSTVDIVGVK